MSDFQPSGVITLTTDFGHKGPFVAVMKGVILTRFPAARLVDLTHETEPHFPAEAGFWLRRAYRWFPRGTTHVAVVDPGVGTERELLVVVHDGHAFVAPDNGLLGNICDEEGAVTRRIADPAQLGLAMVSDTFHGRDILAPVGAEIAAGHVRPEDLGPVAETWVPSWVEDPVIGPGRIKGTVVALDNFGNLITNITGEAVTALRQPVALAGGRRFPLRRTYGLASPGDFIALVNSFGMLELARSEQNAADALGIGRGAPVVVEEG